MSADEPPAATDRLTAFSLALAFVAASGVLAAGQPVRLAHGLVASHAQASRPSPVPAQSAPPGALSKAHEALAEDCESCHSPKGEVEPARCLGCHEPIARRMAARTGVHRDVAGDCQVCHAEHRGPGADLRPLDKAGFDHAAETGFPLTGGHAALRETCERCHKTRSYLTQSPSCSTCHEDPHGGQMSEPCAACHTPAGFRAANRAFHKGTAFSLEGRHLAVPCRSCHVDGAMKGTPTRCYDCHWIRRQDDRYKTRLGNECEQCHRPVSWTAVDWDHGARTGLPLNVGHRMLACDSCHRNATFAGTRPECIACHEADYRGVQSPNHVAAGFPTTCDLCHTPSAPTFGGARFVHASFVLNGSHATQACGACHRSNVYQGTPRECVACHLADYQRTQNPSHPNAGFPTACESCHRSGGPGWSGTFNHGQVFALAGRHGTVTCSSCHRNNQFAGTPRECVACHLPDYQRTQNPNHAGAGFPTACEGCHRSGGPGWSGTFSHGQVFALAGRHGTAACASCHRNNQFAGTPRECVACHLPDYQRTQNPNHAGAGFPTACEGCHRSGGPGWSGTFSHGQVFALQGVHATLACSACHVGGRYRGTPRDCAGCHLARYQGTRNPNHAAAGFPTTCDTCHRATDSSWTQGRFTHSAFPITSGRHAGTACAQCHTDPNNFRVFTCLTCHDRGRMDREHSGRPGYRYDSNACYSCHPQGRAD